LKIRQFQRFSISTDYYWPKVEHKEDQKPKQSEKK